MLKINAVHFYALHRLIASPRSYRCLIDIETTSCLYWACQYPLSFFPRKIIWCLYRFRKEELTWDAVLLKFIVPPYSGFYFFFNLQFLAVESLDTWYWVLIVSLKIFENNTFFLTLRCCVTVFACSLDLTVYNNRPKTCNGKCLCSLL